jgi:DNA modification methylase
MLENMGGAKVVGHSAAFPVGLPSFFIRAYSDKGDLIYDPFLGSGTTLIAAEQHDRRCFGMEISPGYCDLIVRRWQALTGNSATIEDGGQTFAEVSAARVPGDGKAGR